MIARAGLRCDPAVVGAMDEFYCERLGLPRVAGAQGLALQVGASSLTFAHAEAGAHPFYHFAFLVPGNRFADARAWLGERADLLPNPGDGTTRFDFSAWDAEACYCHDPAGSIVELIAHRGVEEDGGDEPFSGASLRAISEIGLVCDDLRRVAGELDETLGLPLWDGALANDQGPWFVGSKAHTLILVAAGRGWLPTGRPAERHPVEVRLGGAAARPGVWEQGANRVVAG